MYVEIITKFGNKYYGYLINEDDRKIVFRIIEPKNLSGARATIQKSFIRSRVDKEDDDNDL